MTPENAASGMVQPAELTPENAALLFEYAYRGYSCPGGRAAAACPVVTSGTYL